MKKEKVKNPSILKRISPYMGNKKTVFNFALLFSAISAILQILPMVFIWLITREVMGSASQTLDVSYIITLAWYTIGSAFLSMLFYYGALSASHVAAYRVEMGMRKKAMEKIINMPLGFFDKYSSGKLRKVIDDNAGQTHSYLAHQLPDLAGVFVTPIIVLILIFFFDWRLGLITLIPSFVGIALMSIMMTEEGEAFRTRYLEQLEVMSSEAVEYVRGIPVVKTFGQSVYSFKHFVDSINKYKDFVYAYTITWKKSMSLYQVSTQAAVFFLIPFTILFMTGDNLGQIVTDFIFYVLISPIFSMLFMRIAFINNFKMLALQVMDRFDEALDYPQMEFVENSKPLKDRSIEFKNVSFSYPGSDNLAIDNISFKLEEGKTFALVGASGSGKTTIARLATRFWDAKQGEILIGGVNIKDISKKDLTEQISFVFQNTQLFKKSIRDNIVFGKENVSSAELDRAIQMSQSKEIIDNLPQGLDTVIGDDRGVYLSGGEQQRIALARAMVKNAPIVLLDEATAFADPENEHLIQKALTHISAGKTSLIIAHRLTSVVDADKILVVDAGKIVEQGSHAELIAQNGMYKKMWDEYQQGIGWKI